MRTLLFAAIVTIMQASIAVGQSLPPELIAPLFALSSTDAEQRSRARDQFQQLIGSYPSQKRKDVVTAMLAVVENPSPDAAGQINAAIALSKLSPYWEANNHEDELKKLYTAFQNTKDPTLQRYLDDALANGKGLYLDAISDFNEDRVQNPFAVAKKFQNMIDLFPKSRYAANSAFYLQQYWTRAAIMNKKIDQLIPLSNKAFDAYWEKASKDIFVSKEFDADARYFRALNDVLQKDETAAKTRLLQLRSSLGRDRVIYVYQLFKNADNAPIKGMSIDRYVPADMLISETIDFITNNPGRLPDAQVDLANKIIARLVQKD